MTPKTQNIIAWILQVLLGLAFIASGGMKLLHGAESAQMFGSLGMPGWFGYLIGGAELLGGFGLLTPQFVRPAALGLMLIMVGAVSLHATKIPGGMGKGIPAVVLLVLLAVVFWLRRPTPTAVV